MSPVDVSGSFLAVWFRVGSYVPLDMYTCVPACVGGCVHWLIYPPIS